ncbi:MAG: BON domain-containing protein [Myxococcota bacterium]|nr:BON domain-containing protein [Myxococcota bacterium]
MARENGTPWSDSRSAGAFTQGGGQAGSDPVEDRWDDRGDARIRDRRVVRHDWDREALRRDAGLGRGGAARAGEGPFHGRGLRGHRRSDERIHEAACERIAGQGWIDASDVEVRVHDREVTLRGSVRSRADKKALEQLVEVSGVEDVHNELRIAPR